MRPPAVARFADYDVTAIAVEFRGGEYEAIGNVRI